MKTERIWICISTMAIGIVGALIVQSFNPPDGWGWVYALAYGIGFVGYRIANCAGKEIADWWEDGE